MRYGYIVIKLDKDQKFIGTSDLLPYSDIALQDYIALNNSPFYIVLMMRDNETISTLYKGYS